MKPIALWQLRCTGISLLSLLALGVIGANPVRAVNKVWNTTDGLWSNPFHWSPNGEPLPGDAVFIGSHANAENARIDLNKDDRIAALAITDGMYIDTHNFLLTVDGNVSLSGSNQFSNEIGEFRSDSRVSVTRNDGNTGLSIGGGLTISSGGELALRHGAAVDVGGIVAVGGGSAIRAEGVLRLHANGPLALINDGAIDPRSGGMTIQQMGTGRVDLDGIQEEGVIQLNSGTLNGSAIDSLTLYGTGLADSFDGRIDMYLGSLLAMHLSEGWTLGTEGRINVFSATPPHSQLPTRIQGGHFTLAGTLKVWGSFGNGVIEAALTISPTANVLITSGGELHTASSTLIQGGTWTLEQQSDVIFAAATEVRGGSFATHSSLVSDGYVSFSGATQWNGSVVVEGVARQRGAATVTGPTTVQATVFDLDGASGDNVTWNLQNSLTLNVGGIDTNNNTFDGTITNQSPALIANILTVHLDDPAQHWTMNGLLSLGGHASIFATRVAGSPMDVTGTINVTASKVRIAADTTFKPGSSIGLAAFSTELSLAGNSRIEVGTVFQGLGAIQNAGVLTLQSGLDTGFAGLNNSGNLLIGDGVGQVELNRFTNANAGVLHIDIGGTTRGVTYDTVVVDGTLTPGGSLAVHFLNGFLPSPGDEFTILERKVGNLPGTTFTGLTGHLAPNDLLLLPQYGDKIVKLVATPHIPCDLTLDGGVDAADMGIVFGQWDGDGTADLNGDDIVDAADAGECFAQWTGDAGPIDTTTTAVPEPAAGVLFALMGMAGLMAARRYP